MNWIMFSCRKATELMEMGSWIGLKRTEKLKLFLHTSMCDACTHYYKQSQFIDKALQHNSSSEWNAQNIVPRALSNESKTMIIEIL